MTNKWASMRHRPNVSLRCIAALTILQQWHYYAGMYTRCCSPRLLVFSPRSDDDQDLHNFLETEMRPRADLWFQVQDRDGDVRDRDIFRGLTYERVSTLQRGWPLHSLILLTALVLCSVPQRLLLSRRLISHKYISRPCWDRDFEAETTSMPLRYILWFQRRNSFYTSQLILHV